VKTRTSAEKASSCTSPISFHIMVHYSYFLEYLPKAGPNHSQSYKSH